MNVTYGTKKISEAVGECSNRILEAQLTNKDSNRLERESKNTGAVETKAAAPQGERRPRGLVNLGNTCFMNSVLQCLANLNSILAFSCSSPSSTTKKLLISVISEIAESSKHPVNPDSLLSNLAKVHYEYKKRRQQDAHDFLLRLLDGCPSLSSLFHVSLSWTVQCERCKTKSITVEKTSHISLPIISTENSGNVSSITRRMKNLHLHGESIDALLAQLALPVALTEENQYDCDECKTKQDAKQSVRIAETGKVLVIHLERYSSDSGKIGLPVAATRQLSVNDQTYQLRGAVVHQGSTLSCGHYIAILPTSCAEQVVIASDSSVKQSSETNHTDEAYMLFYELLNIG